MVIRGVSDTAASFRMAETVSAARKDKAVLQKNDNQLESKNKISPDYAVSTHDEESAIVKTNEQEDDTVLLTNEEVAELSGKLNDFMDQLNTDIRFEYREKLDRLCLQVVDRRNDEIIKEFPPERMLEVLEGLHDWVGLILDKKI